MDIPRWGKQNKPEFFLTYLGICPFNAIWDNRCLFWFLISWNWLPWPLIEEFLKNTNFLPWFRLLYGKKLHLTIFFVLPPKFKIKLVRFSYSMLLCVAFEPSCFTWEFRKKKKHCRDYEMSHIWSVSHYRVLYSKYLPIY